MLKRLLSLPNSHNVTRYQLTRNTMKSSKVVVVIPTHKSSLEKSEICSLVQCEKVLSHYEVRLVHPKGMDTSMYLDLFPSLKTDPIEPKWLKSIAMYNRLRIEPLLYEKYKNFEYILFHELDAYVFRDELKAWCDQGYSNVGAPWFKGYGKGSSQDEFIGVGNGGFCLRKTADVLKLQKEAPLRWRMSLLKPKTNAAFLRPRIYVDFIKTISPKILRNGYPFIPFNEHEDVFWGVVTDRYSWFTTPSSIEALKFSFEAHPKHLYSLNREKLPFGCHKWWAHDPEFWREHIKNT